MSISSCLAGILFNNRMKIFFFISVFILYGLTSFSQTETIALYNEGVKAMSIAEYKQADSLFSLAITLGYKNKDIYFNRALARKRLSNDCGFCIDLICATELGDSLANSAFWRTCPKVDSVFICDENIKAVFNRSFVFIDVTHRDPKTHVQRINTVASWGKVVSMRAINGTDTIYKEYSTISNPSTEVYDLVGIQEPPTYPGGDESMMKFLSKNISYPSSARHNGIQGKVYVTFVVDEFGYVTNVEIYKGVQGGSTLNEEALRVVKLMPKWSSGKQDGKRVQVRFILPIFFRL